MKYISILALFMLFPAYIPASENQYTVPSDIVVFDIWEYFEAAGVDNIQQRANILYFVTSLQGMVNRDSPRLYLFASLALFDIETKHYYDPEYRKTPVTEIDKFWFSYFEKQGYFKGYSVQKITDLKSLIQCYRNQINGLVLWDMQVPATSNIAMMAAACENLLPVSKDLGDGCLFQKLQNESFGLDVKLDLTGRFDGETEVVVGNTKFATTGSAKNDAYLYAIEKYLRPGIINPYKMWFNCDASMWGDFRNHYAKNVFGYLGDKNEIQQNGMYNGDYWIAQKAFIFDLLPWADCKPVDDPDQPLGADNKTWHDILEISYHQRKGEFGVTGGFVPWWLKYTSHTGEKHPEVATEWEFVSLLTSYNMGNDGDAAFGIANASFFQHLPSLSRQQAAFQEPTLIDYDKRKTYIAILMLDYDGSAWLNQMIPSIYNDPARGQMPLNWCMNPVLNERIPHVFKYIYENKTANDFLGFSDDGVSYIQPDSLIRRKGRVKESGVPHYERYAKEMNERCGVKYNVFYIDDSFEPEWAEMAARITPDGFGFNCPIEDQLINGTPVNYVKAFHIANLKQLSEYLDGIYKKSIENKTGAAELYSIRCILMPPSMICQTVNRLDKKYPAANVQFIDIPNYYWLLKYKLEH